MAKNIFEELQEKKQSLIALATKAMENGWIDEQRLKDILSKIQEDVLTVGVIGQMKSGKSTFLNAFVFEDNVLPSATTPMTAALSVITYGPEKKIVADFYTADEWAEQKMQASRNLDDVAGNSLEESKIKAAQELVAKSTKLGSTLTSYLGKTQNDSFDNLIEYVGVDGKYVSITKSVTIYYPKEYLKGVEIVDTPGFNDPIVSREERTKEFLKRADVVLLMLYAGRPFDATDRDILFKNVRQCGSGRILLGVNKYDLPYGRGEMEEEIVEYVRSQIQNACEESGDDIMKELLRETQPILLSAEMALLSHLPMSVIANSDIFKSAWDRGCDTFEISTHPQFAERSKITNLIHAVKNVIEKEKAQILITKPLNAIKAAAQKQLQEVEVDLFKNKELITNLSIPDEELEEKLEKIQKARKRANKKIDSLGYDIDAVFHQIVRTGVNEVDDIFESMHKQERTIIDGIGRMTNHEKVFGKIDSLEQSTQKKIERAVSRKSDDAKRLIKASIAEFCDNIEVVLDRFLEDFDACDFVKKINNKIDLDIEMESLFSDSREDETGSGDESGLFDFTVGLVGEILAAYGGLYFNIITLGGARRDDIIDDLNQRLSKMGDEFNPKPFFELIYNRKDEVLTTVKTMVIEELLKPLEEQIDDILEKTSSRENELSEAKQKESKLSANLKTIKEQISQINFTI